MDEFDLENPILQEHQSDTMPALFESESDHMPCEKARDFDVSVRQETVSLILQVR